MGCGEWCQERGRNPIALHKGSSKTAIVARLWYTVGGSGRQETGRKRVLQCYDHGRSVGLRARERKEEDARNEEICRCHLGSAFLVCRSLALCLSWIYVFQDGISGRKERILGNASAPALHLL